MVEVFDLRKFSQDDRSSSIADAMDGAQEGGFVVQFRALLEDCFNLRLKAADRTLEIFDQSFDLTEGGRGLHA